MVVVGVPVVVAVGGVVVTGGGGGGGGGAVVVRVVVRGRGLVVVTVVVELGAAVGVGVVVGAGGVVGGRGNGTRVPLVGAVSSETWVGCPQAAAPQNSAATAAAPTAQRGMLLNTGRLRF